MLFCANYGLCYLNLTGATKFKYEKKTDKNSRRSSKTTPSCKRPIRSMKAFYGLEKGRKARGDGAGITISIPFDKVSLLMTTRKPAKHCAARSEFFVVFIFSFLLWLS